MPRNEQLNKLHRIAREEKDELIGEKGGIEFHFQVPNFEFSSMMIPSIMAELSEFASSIQEFNEEKMNEARSTLEMQECSADNYMWYCWNVWNSVIGMVLTCKNPEIVNNFHEMMCEFAENQITIHRGN